MRSGETLHFILKSTIQAVQELEYQTEEMLLVAVSTHFPCKGCFSKSSQEQHNMAQLSQERSQTGQDTKRPQRTAGRANPEEHLMTFLVSLSFAGVTVQEITGLFQGLISLIQSPGFP